MSSESTDATPKRTLTRDLEEYLWEFNYTVRHHRATQEDVELLKTRWLRLWSYLREKLRDRDISWMIPEEIPI